MSILGRPLTPRSVRVVGAKGAGVAGVVAGRIDLDDVTQQRGSDGLAGLAIGLAGADLQGGGIAEPPRANRLRPRASAPRQSQVGWVASAGCSRQRRAD